MWRGGGERKRRSAGSVGERGPTGSATERLLQSHLKSKRTIWLSLVLILLFKLDVNRCNELVTELVEVGDSFAMLDKQRRCSFGEVNKVLCIKTGEKHGACDLCEAVFGGTFRKQPCATWGSVREASP